MPTFEIKQVEVPLFGVVEASDPSAWLDAFAAVTTTIAIELDVAALDMIANDLELDAEGLVADAERYVNGRYRAKARGMGGSQLGDLGEVLAFLVNRVPGREVVRVVSWRAGTGQAVKGTVFPQPDFIIKDAHGLAALEVKSTEAFDFVHLRDETKNWTWLQPCSSVRGRREQALPQLAFIGGMLTPQQHSLVVKDGTVVPFPVGKGVAAAVVAVDGRMNELRGNPKYKTPSVCRKAKRDCWSCLPKSCHFALVTMPNAPGMLSLGGTASDGSMRWLHAYRRWSQALTAHDLLAVRASLGTLVETLASWLDGPDILEADVLRGFWGSYLGDAMRSRGFEVEVPGQFGNLSHLESGIEWTPAPLAEPASRETSADDITRSILQDQEPAASFMMSARLRQNDRDGGSISVRGFGDLVEFHLMSETWWNEGSVETVENASSIASRLLSFALEASGWPILGDGGAVPLQKVAARVGDDAVHLGWESKPVTPGSSSWRSWMRGWPIWFDLGPWPPWPTLLFLGDPRVRLRVMPDGRANLRVLRSLLRHR